MRRVSGKRELYAITFGVLTIVYSSVLGNLLGPMTNNSGFSGIIPFAYGIITFSLISFMPLVLLYSGFYIIEFSLKKLWLLNLIYSMLTALACLCSDLLWNIDFGKLASLSIAFQFTTQISALLIWTRFRNEHQ